MFNSFRLPNETKPLKYDIYLETAIHIGLLEYNGSVSIEILILSDTDNIVLHAQNLTIITVTLQEFGNDREVNDVEYALFSNYHFLMIYSSKTSLNLKSGEKYLLKIDYCAKIIDEYNVGFYKIPYKDINGNERWLASTYFSRQFTRLAFPCYDEPSFKANFNIRIAHGNNVTAISNMDIKFQTSLNDKMTLTTFHETPPMSTFLVAFVVGELENLCEQYHNVTQCIYSIPRCSNEGNSSLQTAVKLLTVMEKYFEISYKLPKLDHVALPVFPSNAMENWGIILYKDGKLLNGKIRFGGLFVRNICTLSHEMVHQWFGNLVTPKWYTWWWLSEGFATMYSLHMLDLIYPDQGLLDIYMGWYHTYSYQRYYRPATKFINNEADMNLILNGVIYTGASSILRMFSYILGASTFRKGIKNYLQKLQYSLADEDDFIDCLQKAATEDNVQFFNTTNSVELLVKSWTSQEGYPILNVIRNYENNSFIIHQESQLTLYGGNISTLWWIPVNYATASNPDFSLTSPDHLISNVSNYTIFDNEELLNNNDWLILNKQQTGYYRVNYDEKNWNLIIKALHENPNVMHHYNRAQLLEDANFFSKHKKLSRLIFFDLLSYMEHEENLVPWLVLTNLLYDMQNYLNGISNFKMYLQTLFKPLYSKYGFKDEENDTFLIKFARFEILVASCRLNVENCLNDMKKLILDEWESAESFQFHSYVLCHGFKTLNEDEFKIVYNRMKTNKDSKLLRNIGCSENERNLNFLLENIIKSNENFTQAERKLILNGIEWNVISVLTKFFSKNVFALKDFDMTVKSIVNRMTWYMTDEIGRIKLVNFVKEHSHDANSSSLLEEIDRAFDGKVKRIKIFENSFYKWQIKQGKSKKTKNTENKIQYQRILPTIIEKSMLRIWKLVKTLN